MEVEQTESLWVLDDIPVFWGIGSMEVSIYAIGADVTALEALGASVIGPLIVESGSTGGSPAGRASIARALL